MPSVLIKYPENIADLKSVYVQHFNIIASTEEIFMDACELQPQTMNIEKDSLIATVAFRAVISPAHARRLIDLLQKTLKDQESAK